MVVSLLVVVVYLSVGEGCWYIRMKHAMEECGMLGGCGCMSEC